MDEKEPKRKEIRVKTEKQQRKLVQTMFIMSWINEMFEQLAGRLKRQTLKIKR